MSSKPLSKSRRAAETRNLIKEITSEFEESSLTFSLKYFQDIDGAGQSLNTWLNSSKYLLQGFFNKLIYLNSNNITNAQKDEILALYKHFPDKKKTDFTCLPGLENENWGTIRKINGQKGRVAGFLNNNIFYIVYLDSEHKFYKSEK